MDSMTAK
jgi:signal recognition particle subunit SRP54